MFTSWCFNTPGVPVRRAGKEQNSLEHRGLLWGLEMSWFVTSFLFLTIQLSATYLYYEAETPWGTNFLCVRVCFLHFNANIILTTFTFSCQDSLNLMAKCEISQYHLGVWSPVVWSSGNYLCKTVQCIQIFFIIIIQLHWFFRTDKWWKNTFHQLSAPVRFPCQLLC